MMFERVVWPPDRFSIALAPSIDQISALQSTSRNQHGEET